MSDSDWRDEACDTLASVAIFSLMIGAILAIIQLLLLPFAFCISRAIGEDIEDVFPVLGTVVFLVAMIGLYFYCNAAH